MLEKPFLSNHLAPRTLKETMQVCVEESNYGYIQNYPEPVMSNTAATLEQYVNYSQQVKTSFQPQEPEFHGSACE